jgi:hypothetical protein
MKQMSPFNARQHSVALVMRPARAGSGDPMQGAFAFAVGLLMALGSDARTAVATAASSIRQLASGFMPIVPDALYALVL